VICDNSVHLPNKKMVNIKILLSTFFALTVSFVSSEDPTELGTYLPTQDSFKCGVRLASGFILGGENAKRGEFPFIAALGYKANGSLQLQWKPQNVINKIVIVWFM
jgi:hypothetical protein